MPFWNEEGVAHPLLRMEGSPMALWALLQSTSAALQHLLLHS